MKAVIYRDFNGSISTENVPDPVLDEFGAIIEVKASGICRSDWHGWKGHDPDISLPHVPGHEFAGVVADVGKSVKSFKTGGRVTVPFCCGCGVCSQCTSGNQQVCDNHFQPGFTHWGSFAEFVYIKNADFNLVKLPSTLDFASSASLGCRFITAFRGIVHQGEIKEDMWVAIHGCGGVGLSAIMIASAYGANVIAVDINETNLKIAQTYGASHLINAEANPNITEEILQVTGGGANISMDALGSTETCSNSIKCLAKRGKHIQVGILAPEDEISISTSQLISKELELIGSHGMAIAEYDTIFNLIEANIIDPTQLVERTVSLDEAPEELKKMDSYINSGMVIIDHF